MKRVNIIDRLARLLRWRTRARRERQRVSPATVGQMAAAIERTAAQEIDCAEAYRWLDLFAEKMAQGEDAAALMPLVQQHLEMCPDCREEYETLLRSLAANQTAGPP